MRDLESHTEVRRFGSGWLSGFFGLLFAIAGFGMVIALRFPDWFATPELEIIKHWGGFRGLVHAVLLVSYGLSLLSLLLRPRKALGLTALMIGLAAILVGGRSEEHTSELQSLMRISYAVFCLKKKKKNELIKLHIHNTTLR